ncbi:MAG: polysaccharide deacetylase [Planctomycetaceae bacterium]|nr:polysaccharide deacetylase [Planctomycetaceae bacterium]
MFTTVIISITILLSLLTFCFVVLRGVSNPRSMLFGTVVHRGVDRQRRTVALTFDDGPDDSVTPVILEILRREKVPAAFFVIGSNAVDQSALLSKIHADGHVLGNHSFTHSHGGSLRWSRYWDEEFARTDALISSAIGLRPAFFRPPMGLRNPRMMKSARNRGYTTITWSCRGFDGVRTTSKRILARLARTIRSGSIIVLHDGTDPFGRRDPQATIDALPLLIAKIRARGFEFVRLDELIGVEPYLPADHDGDAVSSFLGDHPERH